MNEIPGLDIACLKAIEIKENKYHIFNIGSGKGPPLNQLIALLQETVENYFRVRYTLGRKIDIHRNILDIRLARGILEWQLTVSFEEGLQLALKYLGEQKIFLP